MNEKYWEIHEGFFKTLERKYVLRKTYKAETN